MQENAQVRQSQTQDVLVRAGDTRQRNTYWNAPPGSVRPRHASHLCLERAPAPLSQRLSAPLNLHDDSSGTQSAAVQHCQRLRRQRTRRTVRVYGAGGANVAHRSTDERATVVGWRAADVVTAPCTPAPGSRSVVVPSRRRLVLCLQTRRRAAPYAARRPRPWCDTCQPSTPRHHRLPPDARCLARATPRI